MLQNIVRFLKVPSRAKAKPVPARTGLSGHIDAIIDRELHGWCSVASATPIRIYADGVLLGSTTNHIMREDVVMAGFANGPAGFSFPLPHTLFDGQIHNFEVRTDCNVLLQRHLQTPLAHQAPASDLNEARAAVVCWDLGHNPAGRAIVLVELLQRLYNRVDLIGPLFPKFGGSVWGPLASEKKWPIIAERVNSFADIERFARRVSSVKYDVVYVCKPRWPSLYIATEMAQSSQSKIVLDIDDYELSFFSGETAAPERLDTADLIRGGLLPMTELEATSLANELIQRFPVRTVSNVALQRKFGGTLIRHARDERTFDPVLYDRDRARQRYGYAPDDKVVMFLGTVRRHKGVVQVAQAIAELKRPDIKFCVIGPITDKDVELDLKDLLKDNVSFRPGVPFDALPRTLAIGDLVCLAQDMQSETAQFQIPAKLTDALAMGIPVIVEDLEPFSDLAQMPGVTVRGSRPLAEVIGEVLDSKAACPQSVRQSFLAEFSTEVNAQRLADLLKNSHPIADPILGELQQQLAGRPLTTDLERAPGLIRKTGRDIVFLWKQNDSGLFGRRSDMVAKYLAHSPLARRVLQFDPAISLDDLNRIKKAGETNPLLAERLVYRNVVSRQIGLADEIGTSRFTPVHDWKGASLFGAPLPRLQDMPQVLAEIFRKHNLSQEAILWVCPTAFDFDAYMQAFPFQHVVADLIDDMRSFSTNERYIARLNENYAKVLARADIIFANCEGVAERFQELTPKPIQIFSNASERLSRQTIEPINLFPDEDVLRIGYVGNMRDRFDAGLIDYVARHDPKWRIILVGATGGNKEVELLRRHDNVSLLGPHKYSDACRLAAGFDVAIIPHQVNQLTDSMNPLKLYLYQELDLPVVTTGVKNLTGANARVFIAGSAAEFVAMIEAAARSTPSPRAEIEPKTVYWDAQVRAMAGAVQAQLDGKATEADGTGAEAGAETQLRAGSGT